MGVTESEVLLAQKLVQHVPSVDGAALATARRPRTTPSGWRAWVDDCSSFRALSRLARRGAAQHAQHLPEQSASATSAGVLEAAVDRTLVCPSTTLTTSGNRTSVEQIAGVIRRSAPDV